MRINPSQTASITQYTPRSTTSVSQPGNGTSGARRTDGVNFSAGLDRMRRVQTAVMSAPDTRTDRVAELKAQVQSGSYQIDLKDLAEKLLG